MSSGLTKVGAGPQQDGFHIRIFELSGEIVLDFGVDIDHLPMPAESAFQVVTEIYHHYYSAAMKVFGFHPPPAQPVGLRVAVQGKRVVLELDTPESMLSLKLPEVAWLLTKILMACDQLGFKHGNL